MWRVFTYLVECYYDTHSNGPLIYPSPVGMCRVEGCVSQG